MNKAADQQDLSGYYKLNLEFHDLLMNIANNRMLAELYLSVIKQTHLFRRRGLVQQGSLKTSNQEHQAILEALERHDGAAAEQALTLHVAKGWTRLANSIEPT
jgi:DNA-binding GntR family transcriptional regulator